MAAYVMTFKPPLASAAADQTIAGELPGDATHVSTTAGNGCETRVYSSRLLGAALPSVDPDGTAAIAVRSFTGSDGAVQVFELDIAAARRGLPC